LPDLDTDRIRLLRIGRDQLPLTVNANSAQILTLGHVHPPDLLHFSRDLISIGQPSAVFVEPEVAIDRQTRGALQAHAAHLLNETERRRRFPLEDR
jgi:hypothetical protein